MHAGAAAGRYALGGWAPPLGLALRADGLSAAMLLTAAVVIGAVALFARGRLRAPAGGAEAARRFVFWSLLLALWGALNAASLGGDLFNLYVALELLTFAAVPLVCLDGSARDAGGGAALPAVRAARLGALPARRGAALRRLRHARHRPAGRARSRADAPTALVAAALMTAGLLAKTALFPLHLWLPPAHAGAPAAASAVLSALVVKASFFLLLRLWFDVMPRAAARGRRRSCWRRWARRRSCSAACWRCGRRG